MGERTFTGNGGIHRHTAQGAKTSGGDWQVACGRCGQIPGGRLFSPGEEMGSGRKTRSLRQ